MKASLLLAAATATAATAPTAHNPSLNITYTGIARNSLHAFLGIPYAADTSGPNRFRPPQSLSIPSGSVIDATSPGPACPQTLSPEPAFPFALTPITETSEDCLHLNIVRPEGVGDKLLPVLVYIHGGSFWYGQNAELVLEPDGLVKESVARGTPIIHVSINYRLGAFGFAQSDALRSEGSLNAGMRDQRFALEWIRTHISSFGGDPSRVTISGQSSGGLAVGLHILAYGGEDPNGTPFSQAICQSQALEPGITGTFTQDAMANLIDATGCNGASDDTLACLRALSAEALQAAADETYTSLNVGDIWLPVVDGDFLPAAPSELVAQGRVAPNITTAMLWCENDVTYFTDAEIKSAADTRQFIHEYVPGVSDDNLDTLLGLYPSDENYAPGNVSPADVGRSPEFYRSARIFRDIIMTCPPILLGSKLATTSSAPVYLISWNQTVLTPGLTSNLDAPGMGAIHTSEFAYIFGNISHYDTASSGAAFDPTPADWALERRASRSWAEFATHGRFGTPLDKGLGQIGLEKGVQKGLGVKDTFEGVQVGFHEGDIRVFVVGGSEGMSPVGGTEGQRLVERCAFINSPEMIAQLAF